MSVQNLRRAIEPLKARARDRALARLRAAAVLDTALLLRLDSSLAAAQAVEATLGELAQVLGGLLPYRRLGQGGWQVGVAGNECVGGEQRRPRHAFTRIEVLVRAGEDGRALELVCHRSVLDRDLQVLRHVQPLAEGETARAEWLEGACLEFAEALLAARAGELDQSRRRAA
jgi:hypothetical protein